MGGGKRLSHEEEVRLGIAKEEVFIESKVEFKTTESPKRGRPKKEK